MSDHETLLGISAVYLFGRRLGDVTIRGGAIYGDTGLKVPSWGANRFIRTQLEAEDVGLARIFAYSFEGSLFELARPTLFLIHGPGLDPDVPDPTNIDGEVEYERLARSPGSSTRTGLGLQTGGFSKGTKVWIYDKGDFTLRLNVETGPFDQVLLASEAYSEGSLARSSGASARSSGARSSGVMARSSGWTSRRGGDLD